MSAKLPMAPPDERSTGGKTDGHLQRDAMIRACVLKSLGRPNQLFRVSVINLWDNNYRVNVATGTDASSVLIPHSYFIVADENGNILQSSPGIRKVY